MGKDRFSVRINGKRTVIISDLDGKTIHTSKYHRISTVNDESVFIYGVKYGDTVKRNIAKFIKFVENG